MKKICQIKKIVGVSALVMMCLFVAGTSSRAEPEKGETTIAPQLDIQMDVQKEVAKLENGKPVLTYVPVETAKKGDVLLYAMTYRNTGAAPASNASVIGPIPKETAYVADSATGKNTVLTYSIDNSATFHVPPITYTVKKPDGTVEKKIATPDMYTHIRFTVKKSLNPGQTGLLKFKVTVK